MKARKLVRLRSKRTSSSLVSHLNQFLPSNEIRKDVKPTYCTRRS